ncbi:MerR family transcriptional regulator [Streptococcus ruminantium]|uniref:MerR family transcriptional regulator n=1 Tax=Streptococcus ruminantium TaxID=1917441 RepID=UPI0012DC48DD|nr:MerR family transcriptional regulator [Streptococcus ruminantium]
MSKYTTGEIAKLCEVTVRTVQYYDTRGILVPSELTEGGRRLYSEDDVKRMKIICFLRELGLSLDSIGQILSEEDPGSIISLLLNQQEAILKREVIEREEKLHKISELKTRLKNVSEFSIEFIGDIAYTMTNKKKLRNLRLIMIVGALPLGILQWASIILWFTKGIWWLFLVWVIVVVPYIIWFCRWYFKKMAYICPQCHTVFQPTIKEGLWAKHTYTTRKLTCSSCNHHGFCVEIAAESQEEIG